MPTSSRIELLLGSPAEFGRLIAEESDDLGSGDSIRGHQTGVIPPGRSVTPVPPIAADRQLLEKTWAGSPVWWWTCASRKWSMGSVASMPCCAATLSNRRWSRGLESGFLQSCSETVPKGLYSTEPLALPAWWPRRGHGGSMRNTIRAGRVKVGVDLSVPLSSVGGQCFRAAQLQPWRGSTAKFAALAQCQAGQLRSLSFRSRLHNISEEPVCRLSELSTPQRPMPQQ
jgi:hypothetical protein